MKEFNYTWNDEIFLLHIELTTLKSLYPNQIAYTRIFNESEQRDLIKLPKQSSHRFILSRSKPDEVEINLTYPDNIIMEVFLIDDRAYYPTKSFYKK